MMQGDIDVELELEWYFGGGAEADLGARSIQSGFEAAMNKFAKGGRRRDARQVWKDGKAVWVGADMPARETRSTHAASDDAIERLHNRRHKLADARRIYARLQRLERRSHSILELHFGDPVRIKGVSLSLLCQTHVVKEATARINARRRKKGRAPLCPRDALQSLATSDDKVDRQITERLAAEAEAALVAVVQEYRHA